MCRKYLLERLHYVTSQEALKSLVKEAFRAFKGVPLPERKKSALLMSEFLPLSNTKAGTVEWLLGLYLQYVKASRSQATLMINLYKGRKVREKLGHMPISKLTTAHLLLYQTERKNEGASNRVINMEIGLLRKALNWAIDMDLIPGHKIKKFPMLPEGKRLNPYLTQEEIELLLKTLNYNRLLRYRILFSILTGLRPREVAFLEWQDIDFEKGLLFVRSKPENPIKDREERAIPLCDTVIEVLKKVRELNPEGRYVFSRNGRPVVCIKAQLKRATQKAGLEKRVFPYMFRHTFAVLALQAGVNLYDLKEIMGHSDITTTERYLHTNKFYLKSAIKRLDPIFEPLRHALDDPFPLSLKHRKTLKNLEN